jgi:hypothetical protein
MVLYIGDDSTSPENAKTLHTIQATGGKMSEGDINRQLK